MLPCGLAWEGAASTLVGTARLRFIGPSVSHLGTFAKTAGTKPNIACCSRQRGAGTAVSLPIHPHHHHRRRCGSGINRPGDGLIYKDRTRGQKIEAGDQRRAGNAWDSSDRVRLSVVRIGAQSFQAMMKREKVVEHGPEIIPVPARDLEIGDRQRFPTRIINRVVYDSHVEAARHDRVGREREGVESGNVRQFQSPRVA